MFAQASPTSAEDQARQVLKTFLFKARYTQEGCDLITILCDKVPPENSDVEEVPKPGISPAQGAGDVVVQVATGNSLTSNQSAVLSECMRLFSTVDLKQEKDTSGKEEDHWELDDLPKESTLGVWYNRSLRSDFIVGYVIGTFLTTVSVFGLEAGILLGLLTTVVAYIMNLGQYDQGAASVKNSSATDISWDVARAFVLIPFSWLVTGSFLGGFDSVGSMLLDHKGDEQDFNILDVSYLGPILNALASKMLFSFSVFAGRSLTSVVQGWGLLAGFLKGDRYSTLQYAKHLLSGRTVTEASKFALVRAINTNDLERIRAAIVGTWKNCGEIGATVVGFMVMSVLGMVVGEDCEKRIDSNKVWGAKLMHLVNPWLIGALFEKGALLHLPWVGALTPVILCSAILIACSYGVFVGPGIKQLKDDILAVCQHGYAVCTGGGMASLNEATKAFSRVATALLSVMVPLGNAKDGGAAVALTAIVILGTALANSPFVEDTREVLLALVKKCLAALVACCGWTAKQCADLLERCGGKPHYELASTSGDYVDPKTRRSSDDAKQDDASAGIGAMSTPPDQGTAKDAADVTTPLMAKTRGGDGVAETWQKKSCTHVLSEPQKAKLAEEVGAAIKKVDDLTDASTTWGMYTNTHKGSWNTVCAWGAWVGNGLGCPTRAWRKAETQASAVAGAL